MRICVYHTSMGSRLAQAITASHPDLLVDTASDTTVAPPACDEIDILIANAFPPGLLARCTRLSWLHLTGTGVDHVVAGERPAGLRVTSSARVPARAVAEFAWMAVLALAKDAPRLVDQHRRREWRLPEARLVAGTRLLLLGFGRIGRQIAVMARACGVDVTAVNRRGTSAPLADRVLPVSALADAAAQADHLVIAVPGTPQTAGLVDEWVLGRLPEHAVVVNVARASVLDTAALVARLRDGRLRAALLDVHDQEPLPPDSPLWMVPNLWLTPHGAYRHPEEEDGVARVFLDNLTAYLAGEPLPDLVALPAPAAVCPAVSPVASVAAADRGRSA
jgi:phosphoglycerate dehydrogenase-like enzyme